MALPLRGIAGVSGAALAGRTVVVTRSAEDSAPWARRLEELGARAVVLPCLVAAPLVDGATASRLASALERADWLVVASRRAVQAVAQLLGGALPESVRVAAVGPETAREAEARWGRVDLVAAEPTARGLARELAALLAAAAARVVVAGAAGGRDDVERVLAFTPAQVTRVDVYRTSPARGEGAKRDLGAEGVSDVLLASPSAVTGLMNCAAVPRTARVITIGPTTTAAARAAGLAVAVEARRPNFDSMLEALR